MPALISRHADELRAVQANAQAAADAARRYEADVAKARRQAEEAVRLHSENNARQAAGEIAHLQTQLEAEMQRAHDLSANGQRLDVLYAPRNGEPDDLKLIWGVGEKLEKHLNRLGVFHFGQIGQSSKQDIAWFESHLGDFDDRITRDKWVEQCIRLASGWRPGNAVGERLTA